MAKSISSCRSGKILLLFALFLAGGRPRSKTKGSEANFEIGYFTTTVPGHLPTKKIFVPALSRFAAISAKGPFCKI